MTRRRVLRMWVRVRQYLDRANVLRAIVSLVLAFTLWGWVTIENNPEVTRLVSGITPASTHLANGLKITGQLPSLAMRLEGPRSELDTLDPTKIKASVNLSGVKNPGDVTVPVEASAPGHIQVLDIYPPTILLHIESAPTQSSQAGDTGQPTPVPTQSP